MENINEYAAQDKRVISGNRYVAAYYILDSA